MMRMQWDAKNQDKFIVEGAREVTYAIHAEDLGPDIAQVIRPASEDFQSSKPDVTGDSIAVHKDMYTVRSFSRTHLPVGIRHSDQVWFEDEYLLYNTAGIFLPDQPFDYEVDVVETVVKPVGKTIIDTLSFDKKHLWIRIHAVLQFLGFGTVPITPRIKFSCGPVTSRSWFGFRRCSIRLLAVQPHAGISNAIARDIDGSESSNAIARARRAGINISEPGCYSDQYDHAEESSEEAISLP